MPGATAAVPEGKPEEEKRDFKAMLEANPLVLLLTDVEKYAAVNAEVIKSLTDAGYKGIYVTINRPCVSVSKMLQNKGVNLENLYFVDCVTTLVAGETKRDDRCIYVEPTNLTAISIAINEMIQAAQGEKFLFFDSLTTLLIYNELGSVEKFSHFIMNRLRVFNLKGVLFSLESDIDPKMLGTFSKLCDAVVKV